MVDFGAGDGRFAEYGRYTKYIGYEIDPSRSGSRKLPPNARIVNACAFSKDVSGATVAIGNPPFVRNQDLPEGWRQQAADKIQRRLGIKVSGLANAWQYFFLLSLASTAPDGLVVLVLPYEWVSRPSSKALRDFIRRKRWAVKVYRLDDETFDHVLTTSSITVVDKAAGDGSWQYYREGRDGFARMRSPTGGKHKLLPYVRSKQALFRAKRGLSPGTQEYLVLTEYERARCGLRIGTDVVRCVTSLRGTPSSGLELDEHIFKSDFVDAGRKCWLIRTDRKPSDRLMRYLKGVPPEGRATSTCLNRDVWWKFAMPTPPGLLMATGFRERPKILVNRMGAIAVGSVCGISGGSLAQSRRIARALRDADYAGRVVSHSNGLRKLEINQINALIAAVTQP